MKNENNLYLQDLAEPLEIVIHQVENGEVCIIKRGKIPIAEITPIKNSNKPKWKRSIKKVILPEGISAADYIIQERNL